METNIQDIQLETRRKAIKRLIAYRNLMGLSQKDIADKIGVSRPNITRFESEDYNPTIDMIVKIADSMNLDVEINFIERENKNLEDKEK